jgi:uncharacterized protein
VHMTAKDINKIKNVLPPVFEKYGDVVTFAYLFGSTVRSTTYPSGDIDIAVFLSPKGCRSAFDIKLSLHADMCRALKRNDVDALVLNTTINLMLLDEIVRHGVVIYDANPDAREEYELKILHQTIDFKTQRLAMMGV